MPADSSVQHAASDVIKKVRRSPILVTGSHRSGSTWVGRMIAKAPGIGYIHEPFNRMAPPGVSGAPVRHWYTYVSTHNQDVFYPHLERTLAFRYNLGAELRAVRRPRHIGRIMRHGPRFAKHRLARGRPLMKDPLALFSAEWLASAFDADVLMLLRHPAAFLGSIKRLNWEPDFTQFIEQPALIRDHLLPFEAEIVAMARGHHSIVDKGALIWKITTETIAAYHKAHPDWLLFRHEDLSRDPVKSFESIFDALDIDYTEETLTAIEEHRSGKNPKDEPTVAHSLLRDSKANIWTWKKRLTEAEIASLRTQVESVSAQFYSDNDW